MILRKPYAFFIKIFKPMHIFMSVLVLILIYKTNNILTFFNQYMHSNDIVTGEVLQTKLVTADLFVIPISLMIFCLIFLGIMFNKKKPVFFYVSAVFSFLVITIITMYSWNVLGVMEKDIISMKLVKLIHDLIVLNMLAEICFFVLLIIRGLGINFKKFSFDSDISKFDVSESDKEEFELNINFDVDAAKRERRRKLRYFKYLYKENKLVFNLFITIFVGIVCFVFLVFYFKKDTTFKEGVNYNLGKFNLNVNKTILLKEDFEGKVLTNNNLIVVDVLLQTNFSSFSLFKKDFTLEIGDANFYPVTKFSKKLIDLGTVYNENILTEEYEHYLFVFEIPDKYLKSDMFLDFNNQGTKTKIKLEPRKMNSEVIAEQKNIGEKIKFNDMLEGITFKVIDFSIQEKYQIKYKFCVEDKECLTSIEYIKPSINENFDKAVLKLNVEYSNESKLKLDNFYDFFEQFGAVKYLKDGKWFSQINNFEELKSKKVDNKNNIYIGVNEEVLNSESIKLIFNIRGSSYEYTLK